MDNSRFPARHVVAINFFLTWPQLASKVEKEEFAKSIIRKSSKAPTSQVYFSLFPKPDADKYVEIEVLMGDFRTCFVCQKHSADD